MINFDHSATTPLDRKAADVYETVATTLYGNMNSLHDIGGKASRLLERSRVRLAEQLDVAPHRLYFTASGTESNLLAITQLALGQKERGMHIVMSRGEHPSVDSAVAFLETIGFRVTSIPLQRNGIVDLDALKRAMTDETTVLIVQHANPEIGVIQPIEQLSYLAKRYGAALLVDAVQTFGELDVSDITPYVDALTIASHKIYGPKGVAAAYIRPRVRWSPLFPGLTHESGFRGGTVNVPGIVSFVTASTEALRTRIERQERYKRLRERFLQPLRKTFGERLTVYEHPTEQLPHIIGFGIYPIEGQLLMLRLNEKGYAISTGSACQVGMQVASKAMYALGVSEDRAKEFVRVSFGRDTTEEEIDGLAQAIIDSLRDHTARMPKQEVFHS